MIWSQGRDSLREIRSQFEETNRLRKTDKIHNDLDPSLKPIEYFEIKREHNRKLGRIVVAFAHISETGVLDKTAPTPIYGVTESPNTLAGHEASLSRTIEAHAYAEHLALTRGIFTSGARLTAEIEAADIIPRAYREEFIRDRLAHLAVLLGDVGNADSHTLKPKQKRDASNELLRAVKHFES